MRIEAITGRKIVVELSAQDMEQLDITYEALDYASVDTRRVIWIILDHVRESTGCDIDPSGQLLIDAMPRPTGGCILFFTIKGASAADPFELSAPERVLRKQEQLLVAFEFENINALLDCAAAYARISPGEDETLFSKSELYTHGTRYRLLLCPAQELSRVIQFFGEYARFYSEQSFAAERTREHWQPLEQSFAHMSNAPAKKRPNKRSNLQFSPGNIYASIDS